jgi:predicted secreted Zn-dependent protease
MGRAFLPLLALVVVLPACVLARAAARSDAAPGGGAITTTVVSRDAQQGAKVTLAQTLSLRRYAVVGTTAAEVRAALDAYGPSGPAERFDGLTEWSLTWVFRYTRPGAYCDLVSAIVDLQVTVIVPELGTPEEPDEAVLTRWEAYVAALESHELGHVVRQGAMARDLAQAFEDAEPGPDCSELGARLKALGDAYVEAMREADVAYDLESGHGRSQGAVFP